MRVTSACLFFALLVVWASSAIARPSCIDENGNAVDWWISLKTAKDSSSSIPHLAEGHAYAYYDAHSSGDEFFLSANDLSTTDSALGKTLTQIYSGASKDDNGWLFYNDETPERKKSQTHGHTKGVMYFDKSGGFWLVHSVPRFADESWTKEYSYPDAESIYGQSMLCMSFDSLKELDAIAGQMFYTWPQIFDSNLPESMESVMDNFSQLIDGYHIRTEGGYNTEEITTAAGQNFVYFAKNSQYGGDLYSGLVEPYIKGDMLIETWMRPYEPDCCTPECEYNSMNVNLSRIATTSGESTDWTETQDHSKWGISESSSKEWVCIGDINRNKSQWSRGGGTVCFRNRDMWKAFRTMIQAYDPCSQVAQYVHPRCVPS